MARIVVVGSVNMDVVTRVARHPRPGETVQGMGTAYSPGGKGANQAVAAARAGADVAMLAAVGDDSFGPALCAALQQNGVDSGHVLVKAGASGLAFITVDEAGENSIILSPGANGKLSAADVDQAIPIIQGAEMLLVQNEIPWETTWHALASARRAGVRTLWNPAPAMAVSGEVLQWIDWIVLNETEANVITGVAVDGQESAHAAARWLVREGVQAAVVTLGSAGSVYADRSGTSLVTPAFPVHPVDTTAAGDTFIGALAARLGEGGNVAEALAFATAAAALAVTRPGAQSSIPSRSDIESFLRERKAR
ncbi:MAG: ribokinase [Alicyclobacillaceae bacterium]|nr:ribokinase [Alicyclobacillaceae bacterium]